LPLIPNCKWFRPNLPLDGLFNFVKSSLAKGFKALLKKRMNPRSRWGDGFLIFIKQIESPLPHLEKEGRQDMED